MDRVPALRVSYHGCCVIQTRCIVLQHHMCPACTSCNGSPKCALLSECVLMLILHSAHSLMRPRALSHSHRPQVLRSHVPAHLVQTKAAVAHIVCCHDITTHDAKRCRPVNVAIQPDIDCGAGYEQHDHDVCRRLTSTHVLAAHCMAACSRQDSRKVDRLHSFPGATHSCGGRCFRR